jgi:phage terminase small subunit
MKPRAPKPLPKDILKDAKAAKMQPLEYMLAVMNDPTAEEYRRDRMAIAAAPFCHPRISDAVKGKKDQQTEAAEMAGMGTVWAKDLEFEDRPQ